MRAARPNPPRVHRYSHPAEIVNEFTTAELVEIRRRDPKLAQQIEGVIEAETLMAERIACADSLIEFLRCAWPHIGESGHFIVNWHHEVIADYLEAIARQQIQSDGTVLRNVVDNQPPRTTKTNVISIAFPAWVWAQPKERWGPLMGPHVKFFCLSYGATLAEEIAVKMLRLVMGDWYQKRWGNQVQILADQQSRAHFANSAGGERLSNSIEGGILGRGGDIQIIDDPHNTKGVESLLMRQATIDGMRNLSTRVTDPRRTARILVMQRLHQGDATDYALKNWDDLVHICFPMRFESDRACEMDIRERDGELLWPEVFNEPSVSSMEKELLEYGTAGQLQQRPIPRGGGIIKRDWLQPWPPWNADGTFPYDMVKSGRIQYPALEYIIGWVDTAYTEKQQNDPSAMIVLGVFRAEGKGRIERRGDGTLVRVADDYGFPKVLLLYGWQKRLTLHGPPEEVPPGVTREEWASIAFRQQRQEQWGLVEWVADTVKRYRVEYLGIETQAAGHSLEQELRRVHSDMGCGVETLPAKGDKWARLYSVSGLISSGQVYVPTYEDGTHPSWAEPLITELVMFPRAEHDEAADLFSGGLKHLRDIGLMERKEEFDRAEDHSMRWETNRRLVLPYET
jgi:predicted phage terminase large subunit-like protein